MSVFLSCFRKKKKGDKKKGDKKNKAPIAAPPKEPTPSPKATADNNKPSVTVEDHSQVDVRRLNGSKEFQETNEPLGDFSAVRETQVLKSYRKPPPPQNRARQSKAPRALLQSSMENLDLFSGSNDELFRASDDMNTSTPDTSRDENDGNEKAEKDKELDGSVKKVDTSKESSQGRSSMLEEINSTLASIHTNDTGNSAEDIPKEVKVKEAAAAVVPSDIRKSMEDITKAVQQKMIAASAKIADEEKDEKETKVESDSEDVPDKKSELDVMKKVESTLVESAVADIAEEVKEKERNFEKETEEQVVRIEKEVGSCLHNGIDSVKEDANQVKIEDIACKVEEDVVTKIDNKVEMAEIKITESLGVDNNKDDEEEVVVTETYQIEVEKPKVKEIKIPPKVSPKPSPKMKPRSFVENIVANVATESSDTSQKSEEEAEEKAPPSPKSFIDKIVEKVEEVFTGSGEEDGNNGEIENNEEDEKMEEKVDSPPPTPTTPTSPTSPTLKGQSRIPTSKKASGIPKLAFGSPKPASPSSPISSPADSAAKRLDHAASDLTKTNHTNDTPSSPTSPTGDSDLSRDTKESSPFNDDNRNSKRKLTKLRYSGRKKSSESKSDESGSERGSRAGSEAKEEVAEMEKNSRIPVRGGSKPRSSPPKSLGN